MKRAPFVVLAAASNDGEVHKLAPDVTRIWRYTGHDNEVWGVAVDKQRD